MLDWHKLSSDILANAADQGKLTQLLSDLETEVTTFNSSYMELQKQAEEQSGQIESLQRTNMNLFLKVGNPTPPEALQETRSLSYDDLFNEKGELK